MRSGRSISPHPLRNKERAWRGLLFVSDTRSMGTSYEKVRYLVMGEIITVLGGQSTTSLHIHRADTILPYTHYTHLKAFRHCDPVLPQKA